MANARLTRCGLEVIHICNAIRARDSTASEKDQLAIFCCNQSFKTEARKRHSLPICTPAISPLRAIFWSVFGWIFRRDAASSESRSRSNEGFASAL
jgi:hypothetical protein